MPGIDSEKKNSTRKNKVEESNCSACSENKRKTRNNCPECLEERNSREEKTKTLKDTKVDENDQRISSSTKPFRLQVQDFKQKQPQSYYWWSKS